ncbi:MAG: hypothetical protein AAF656_08200, partial [Planctomycetota bacterium]
MTLSAEPSIAKIPQRTADPSIDVQRGTGTLDQNPPGLSLWALWREDLASHGGDWTRPGFRALAVHRFGNWRMSKP